MKIKDFIEAGGKVEVDSTFTLLSVPGKFDKNAVKIPTRYLFSVDQEEIDILEYYLDILYNLWMPKTKSKEQVAAENAVQKAEEALKAAKSVLEKVKESK